MRGCALKKVALAALVLLFNSGCNLFGKDDENPFAGGNDGGGENLTAQSYIYVASGRTYAGNGVTMVSTPSALVTRYREDGTFDCVIKDFNNGSGDFPVAIANFNDTAIVALIENAGARRLIKLPKDCSGTEVGFVVNPTALNSVLRHVFVTPDGGYLVSKTSAIEKFTSSGARVTSGANPFVNAPAGACATSTALNSKIALGPNGSILIAHAGAAPNNQINLVSANGYLVAGDCLASVDGPTTGHFPTSLLLHAATGKLLAGFGNNTGAIHQIYSYDVTATTLANPLQLYNNPSVVQGVSELAELSDGTVLVGSSASAFNNISRFSYNGSTFTYLQDLIPQSIYTKPVADILVLTEGF